MSTGDVCDGVIFFLVRGTGLHLTEIVGLNVGAVFAADGTHRVRVRIRAEIAKGRRAGDLFLPDRLLPKLKRFWTHKRKRGEGLLPGDPLFCSQSRRRISKRRVQFAWRTWQKRAGFDRLYPFHSVRHSSITNVYRSSRDLFLAQRFARHASPLTTVIYTHPSDDEMASRVRGLPAEFSGLRALEGPDQAISDLNGPAPPRESTRGAGLRVRAQDVSSHQVSET